MIDLSTKYLGLNLTSPLVASAGPLQRDLDNVRKMEDAGVAAIVMHSLFEEQIELEGAALDRCLSDGSHSFAEALNYFPDMAGYNIGPQGYLDHLRRAKAVTSIPIIGSLNGATDGGWIDFAKQIEQAGADALELNIYHLPTEMEMTAEEVERNYVQLLQHVKRSVRIPVAVKLSPMFSSIPNMAKKLDMAGADGLVLFNRFYQPDFDLEVLEVSPRLTLSEPSELLLRLHWTAILWDRVRTSVAITGGVHSAEDVLKCMMAGAQAAMMTSCLLINGIGHITRIKQDLERWMTDHEYVSIRQMQGSMSYLNVPDRNAFERGNYMKVLSSYVTAPAASKLPQVHVL